MVVPYPNLFRLGYGCDPNVSWLPTSLGSSLAAWYKADAGCYTDAACLFASASSQYLTKTSPTFAPTTKMTIAFDYKPTTVGASQDLAARWTTPATQNQFVLRMDTAGALILYVASDPTDGGSNHSDSTEVLSAGTNYRIVIVYDGTLAAANRVKVYIDGVAATMTVTGTIPTTLTTSTADLTVGIGNAGVAYANGALARLGFSSDALSGAALTAAHTSTFWASMTAERQADWFSFYNLCEASGTRVDSTGLNDLTAVNTPTVAAGPGEGLAVNNSPVKRWESRYGVPHLLQATISAQPLWLAAIQNGLPVVRFNGSSRYLMTAGFTLNQPEDVYIAGRYVTDPSGSGTLFDGGTQNHMRVYGQSATDARMYAGGFGPVLTPSGITAFHAYRFLFSGGASIASSDAGADATGDAGSNNAGGVTLGANGSGGSEFGNVEVGELFIASAAAPAPASPKAYLKARWGTP